MSYGVNFEFMSLLLGVTAAITLASGVQYFMRGLKLVG